MGGTDACEAILAIIATISTGTHPDRWPQGWIKLQVVAELVAGTVQRCQQAHREHDHVSHWSRFNSSRIASSKSSNSAGYCRQKWRNAAA